MSNWRAPVWMAVVGLSVLGLGSGCATRGYVRSQVADARADLQQQIEDVRNSSSQALERAELAYGQSNEAKDLALGRVGFHEVTQYTLRFDFDSDELDGEAIETLNQTADQIQSRPDVLVDVYGFADRTGSERYNYELGQRRANEVMRYLLDRMPSQLNRFAAVSYGEDKPLGEQETPEERAANRRVVVSLIERVPLEQQNQAQAIPEEVPEEGSQASE
ncbi:MAG: OmpA family protein [Candidatus Eisenbacteria bacterium]|nr:OmpA family protein [Candidatus Eisenbacteria bacterium]